MTRRYNVRIRNPMELHVLAVRLNADHGNETTARVFALRFNMQIGSPASAHAMRKELNAKSRRGSDEQSSQSIQSFGRTTTAANI